MNIEIERTAECFTFSQKAVSHRLWAERVHPLTVRHYNFARICFYADESHLWPCSAPRGT